jgi:hypothetical protein
MLTHQKLKVYEKALALAACAQELSASWGKGHAIVEQQKALSTSIQTAQGRERLSRIIAMLNGF